MKKLLSIIRTYDERLGSFFSGTAVGQILIALILAAAVACASSIADEIKEAFEERDFYTEISLRSSRAHLEDVLGHPRFENYYSYYKITDASYFTKHAMVRVFYYDGNIIGYFITSMDKNYKGIGQSAYIGSEERPLGSYTYQKIDGSPCKIRVYQNSSALKVYLEKYHYDDNNIDGHNNYYIYFDKYGFDKNELTSEDEYLNDEEVKNMGAECMEGFVDTFIDRSRSYPNTYGVCADEYSEEVENSLLYAINY